MKNALKNSAFTLFELLIVILIISLIYGVFVQKITSYKKKEISSQISLASLKKNLLQLPFSQKAEILCINSCTTCYIQLDGKKRTKIDFHLDAPVIVYTRNIRGNLQQKKFAPIFNENGNPIPVCLRFVVNKNGSSSSFIVQYHKKYYVFLPYFYDEALIKNSLTSAKETWINTKLLPYDSSEYNFL